ncbi:monovalent cation/H(+) antiporter subunit G [Candidatus Nitrotoga sp. AM1P]|uniref:monovalent cation/H(+) antiporter subunit G n=1 Tax=Candidatus Nitrotoga sp. AM1P TaxID=2559597 RepID=UPI0010B7FD71|nr:monovalent cation/H(+) antiporter subunit G [Candidatus Nitrotoga sp. AM1P]BBJ23661.1 multisubunit potassium/proton antiporter, PhaG subunit [Candidatus Nitrotoga sp. AM1P]
MNEMETIPLWAAALLVSLLILGGSIILIGALGLIRLPDFYQRIHGPAIIVTLGTGCVLMASMLYFTVLQSRLVLHELLIAVFVLMTAPVVSMLIMRAAVYRDLRARKRDSGVGSGDVYRFPEQE